MKACMAWDERVPYPKAPAVPVGLTAAVLHRADEEFPFLHDTMITTLGGKLFAAWYNCTEDEIAGRTVIRGCWLKDDGTPETGLQVVAEDEHFHAVPVTFFEENGGFYAFATRMTGHDVPVGYMVTEYVDGAWKIVHTGETPVLLNTLPLRLRDGRWLLCGRVAGKKGEHPLIPCAVTCTSVLEELRLHPMPGVWNRGKYPLPYPETTMIADKGRIHTLVRNEHGPALCFESTDSAASWSSAQESTLPAAPVKMCAGRLSDGRQYVLFNEKTERNDRSRLVMALRKDMDSDFDRLYLLRDGFDEQLNAGPYWHYPCACEKDGVLHITCTVSEEGIVRHAALLRVPVASL